MPVGANIFQVADVRETSPADSRLFQSSAQAVSTSTHTGAGSPPAAPIWHAVAQCDDNRCPVGFMGPGHNHTPTPSWDTKFVVWNT